MCLAHAQTLEAGSTMRRPPRRPFELRGSIVVDLLVEDVRAQAASRIWRFGGSAHAGAVRNQR